MVQQELIKAIYVAVCDYTLPQLFFSQSFKRNEGMPSTLT